MDYVSRPKDRPFAFVAFEHEESVPYAIALFRGIRLFDRVVDMKPRDGTEQARKINAYMAEVAQRRRQITSSIREGRDHQRSPAVTNLSMPPPPLFAVQRPMHYASMMNIASGGMMSPFAVQSGFPSRSTSWPKFSDSPHGAMPLVPPPPPPPFGRYERYDREERYSSGRDDRRNYDYVDLDNPHQPGGSRDRDYYRRGERSRSPDYEDDRQQRSRKRKYYD